MKFSKVNHLFLVHIIYASYINDLVLLKHILLYMLCNLLCIYSSIYIYTHTIVYYRNISEGHYHISVPLFYTNHCLTYLFTIILRPAASGHYYLQTSVEGQIIYVLISTNLYCQEKSGMSVHLMQTVKMQ